MVEVQQNPPLPTLTLPDNGEPVIAVRVRDEIAKSEGRIPVWVADEQPARRLGHGQLISLENDGGKTGLGLLTSITDLRQHWVTWTVTSGPMTPCGQAAQSDPTGPSEPVALGGTPPGGPTQCRLRVPIPWTSMTGIEAVAHAKHYHALPPSPPPHHRAQPPSSPENNTYPYHHTLDPSERRGLETRLEGITRRRWEWRPVEERRRRVQTKEKRGKEA
ncbi:hypothetical protein FOMPIDRAFT_1054682 [Fomitopsis schrenkii]|uniref:Uncharacterized protein n=1 Tax=Fomitopsis schrenkii TaxID=2126942 RepID=S8DQH2_FOMSC|nr:hypothetical protein FOMPIDRAFT_1054682 [Fomitopsis schrenkii]